LNELDEFEGVTPTKEESTENAEDDDDEEEEQEEESEEEYMSEDDEEEEEEDEDEDMEDNDDDSQVVSMSMLNEWSAAAENGSTAAWKKMLMAFRSIVRSDEDATLHFTYRVESSKGTAS
jgi:nucleolar complex protein 2